MNLHDIHQKVHKGKKRRRIGRGESSGWGKTAGRGHKGQGQLAGWSTHPGFEGGQMPLVRRIPKRGFNNMWARSVATVNLGELDKLFEAGEEVSPETLKTKGRLKMQYDLLKILGNGELTKKLKVSAHRFSDTARQKLQAAGAELVELPGPAPVERKTKKSGEKKQKS